MANDKIIKEIADKLNNHRSAVNPQMWQAVSSQVGASGAAGAESAFGIGKVAAIVLGVTAVSVASYFGLKSGDTETTQKTATKKQQVDFKSNETEKTNQTIEAQPELISDATEKITVDKSEAVKPAGQTAEIHEIQVDESDVIQIRVPDFIGVRTIEKSDKINEHKANTNTNQKTTVTQEEEPEVKTDKPTTTNKSETKTFATSAYPIKTNYNVFTPDGDGVNDYFEVVSEGVTDYSIVIMDANNKKIWGSNDPKAKWDGRDLSGQKVSKGRYLCLIAGNGPDGKPFGKHEILNIRY